MHRTSQQLRLSIGHVGKRWNMMMRPFQPGNPVLSTAVLSPSQWMHPKHFAISRHSHRLLPKAAACSRREMASNSEDAASEQLSDDSQSKPMSTKSAEQIVDELRQLHHIRALVSQLYTALHVPDTYQTEMQSLHDQLNQIQSELRPLEEKKVELLMRAERRAKILAWAGLGFMGMQFGFLARLTWWEYSWDIIEPVTYFVTYGTAMGLYAYYLVTRQDYSFPAVTERWTALAFHKNVRRSKWEMNRYIELRRKLNQLQSEIEKMSMLAPRPLKSTTSLSSDSDPTQQGNAA